MKLYWVCCNAQTACIQKLTPLSRFSTFSASFHLNIISPFIVAVFPTTAHDWCKLSCMYNTVCIRNDRYYRPWNNVTWSWKSYTVENFVSRWALTQISSAHVIGYHMSRANNQVLCGEVLCLGSVVNGYMLEWRTKANNKGVFIVNKQNPRQLSWAIYIYSPQRSQLWLYTMESGILSHDVLRQKFTQHNDHEIMMSLF